MEEAILVSAGFVLRRHKAFLAQWLSQSSMPLKRYQGRYAFP
jgi:hypothetical protein